MASFNVVKLKLLLNIFDEFIEFVLWDKLTSLKLFLVCSKLIPLLKMETYEDDFLILILTFIIFYLKF